MRLRRTSRSRVPPRAALATALLVLGVAPAVWAQDDCSSLVSGDYSCEITTVDGLRSFLVHVPASVTGAVPVPLVIDMHGYTSNASQQRSLSGWLAKSDIEGFVVSWPQGIGDAWNSQGQCCSGGTQDDVAFIETVVAEIQAAANIDPHRVYATGLSNGGSQTHTMACESADLFAGAAAVSFGLSGGANAAEIIANCNPSRGIPVIHFHGTSDELVDFTDGVFDSLGALASLDAWRQIQSCDPNAVQDRVASDTLCLTHPGCTDGASVSLCAVTAGTHVLYGQLDGTTIADVAWRFFETHSPAVPIPALPFAAYGVLGLSAGLSLWLGWRRGRVR